MLDLDECAARAIASPVADPPEMNEIRRRARRHRRKRNAARVIAATSAVLLVGVGGVAVMRAGSDSSSVEAGNGPAPVTGPGTDASSITRPVLDTCTATSAAEGRMTGTGHTDPDQAGEVFAVPGRGTAGPLAVLLRFPRAGVPASPNTTVAGRPARVDTGSEGQGGIQWSLADGRGAIAYARDLSASEMTALAESISAQSAVYPAGLVSLGPTSASSWARSTCTGKDGSPTTVEVVHGPKADRYARVLAEPPGTAWDEGDATFLVVSPPPRATAVRPRVHQATAREWNALLEAARPPRASSSSS